METSFIARPWAHLDGHDPAVYSLIEQELGRQRRGIELIASENFASPGVMAAMGSVLTNKYAEGYPGRRYYGGCEHIDEIESLAIERAKALFGSRFANVQPHSGAQANAAVYLTLAKPGDRILGLELSHGGHLTHGSKVNFSGLLYESHFYGLDPASGRIDYDKVAASAREVRPKILVAGASAYPREIDFAVFAEIAREVEAYLVVDMAHIAGLVAAGLHPDPMPHADVVTTTTHKTLRGPRGGLILWNDERWTKELNKGVFPGTQGGPLEHVIAAKAVSFREAAAPSFREYQERVLAGAKALGEGVARHGLDLVSGGTDNHLVLVDLRAKERTGKEVEAALQRADITVNKNTVPGDPQSPFVTSGLRLGSPAVTSRGMDREALSQIGDWVGRIALHPGDEDLTAAIGREVAALCQRFPLYSEWPL